MSRHRRAGRLRATVPFLRRPWACLPVLVVWVWGLACTGPLRETPGGFVHEKYGYRIAAPGTLASAVSSATSDRPASIGSGAETGISAPASTSDWKRVHVEGSVLAYRRSTLDAPPVRMSLSSRCKGPLAEPELLARHLRIGIPEHVLRQSEAVDAGTLVGWQQVFDATQGGAVVRVKTVTLVGEPCAFDWVLTAKNGEGFEEAEPVFDAWWRSLELPGASAEGGSS